MKRARSPSPSRSPEAKRPHVDPISLPDLLPELWDIIMGLLPILDKIICLAVNRAMRGRAIRGVAEQFVPLRIEGNAVVLVAEWHSRLYRVDMSDYDASRLYGGLIAIHLHRMPRIGTEWRWPTGHADRVGFISFPCPYHRCNICANRLRPSEVGATDEIVVLCKACRERIDAEGL